MIPYALCLIVLPIVILSLHRHHLPSPGRYLFASLKLVAERVPSCHRLILELQRDLSRRQCFQQVHRLLAGSGQRHLEHDERRFQSWRSPTFDAKGDIIVGRVSPRHLVVVLAIGESSRRKNFSLYGYKRRETNPVLKPTEGLHLLNGVARRASTLYALPEILERTMSSSAALPGRSTHLVLRELHAIRQLRVRGRDQGDRIAAMAESATTRTSFRC